MFYNEFTSRFLMMLTKEEQEKLQNARVLVFGVGGVGGSVVHMLARSGVKHICIVDFDTISTSNINRQLVANATNVGKFKVDELESQLQQINPEIIKVKGEQYKKVAKTATNKYIESQALRLGISSKDIIRKLPENYSFSDIDKICEDLNRYKININSLPISLQENKKIKYDEADNVIGNIVHNSADDIDDSLLALANLK